MLGALLASNPKTRDALLDVARRHQLKQDNAMEVRDPAADGGGTSFVIGSFKVKA